MGTLTKEKLKQLKKLKEKKYRKEYQQFIVEGYHLVEEAYKCGLLALIVTSNKEYKLKGFNNILYSNYSDVEKLSNSVNPQDIIGVCNFKKINKLGDNPIILNNINDPGNLGTIIRTAAAFGFSDVIVQGVDIYNDKVLRSTQGAIFKINVFNVDDLETFLIDLKQKDYELVGTLLDKKAIDYNKYNQPNKFALIFGNESKGIEEKIKKIIDKKIYIPINFESLNVSIAAGIIMAKLSKLN